MPVAGSFAIVVPSMSRQLVVFAISFCWKSRLTPHATCQAGKARCGPSDAGDLCSARTLRAANSPTGWFSVGGILESYSKSRQFTLRIRTVHREEYDTRVIICVGIRSKSPVSDEYAVHLQLRRLPAVSPDRLASNTYTALPLELRAVGGRRGNPGTSTRRHHLLRQLPSRQKHNAHTEPRPGSFRPTGVLPGGCSGKVLLANRSAWQLVTSNKAFPVLSDGILPVSGSGDSSRRKSGGWRAQQWSDGRLGNACGQRPGQARATQAWHREAARDPHGATGGRGRHLGGLGWSRQERCHPCVAL